MRLCRRLKKWTALGGWVLHSKLGTASFASPRHRQFSIFIFHFSIGNLLSFALLLPFCSVAQTSDNGESPSDRVLVSATVLDPGGQPVEKAKVVPFPVSTVERNTDAQGRATFLINRQQLNGLVFIARDPARDLVASIELAEDATNATLKLAPGLVLAGRVTDSAGNVSNAQVRALLTPNQQEAASGGGIAYPPGLRIRTDAEGRFEIKPLPPNSFCVLDVSARGHGQDHRSVELTNTAGERIELAPFQLSIANRRVSGVVLDPDGKPLRRAMVNVMGETQPQSFSTLTESDGRFVITNLTPGSIQLLVNGPNGGFSRTELEAGETNITVQLTASSGAGRISGTVTTADGKPAPDVSVLMLPLGSGERTTDAEGRFKLSFNSSDGGVQIQRVLIARDAARNLAVALDLESDATNADIHLEPGVIVSGRIVDPQGKGVANADVSTMFISTSYGASQLSPTARADADGRYEVKPLPAGRSYSLNVSAKGFGSDALIADTSEVTTNSSGARVLQLDPVELPVADQQVAGVVLDADEKPVPQAFVSVNGRRQPSITTQADNKGRFVFTNVCPGQIILYANARSGDGYASMRAEAGDTNVTMQLRPTSSGRVVMSAPATLKGKPLPSLASLGLSTSDAPAGQPIVILLIDAEQRPSRRALKVLTDQAAALKEKHIPVILLQAGPMDDASYAGWLQDAALPFPIARLKDASERGRAAWGATALPWLILADKNHRVVADGFAAEELEAKLNDLAK